MHILFLSDNFPPEVNAPASRTFEHCKNWVKLGHKVTVITCFPNFPEGRIFSGYKNKLYFVEELSGIKVIRVWTYIYANEGFIRRILDHLSFMISSLLASFFVRRVDVIIATSPQFFCACSGFLSSKLKFKPWIFEVRDLWPESISTLGILKKENFVYKVLQKIEMLLYKGAQGIIVVTHTFKDILIDKGINEQKISVITNGVDLEFFKHQELNKSLKNDLGLKGKFLVGYIGTHGMAHGLKTLLEAMEKLQKSKKINIALVLIGNGAKKDELIEESKKLKLKNTFFFDSVSKEELKEYWSILDASIIHLKKDPLFESVIPSKLFESIGMGIPVIHGVNGESKKIVKDNELGVCFNPESSSELSSAILNLYENKEELSDYKINALIASKLYSRKELAERMINTVREIIKK